MPTKKMTEAEMRKERSRLMDKLIPDSDIADEKYLPPVPPQEGYRRGFEPRPGESDAERLAREVRELKRRLKGKVKGADYRHYRNAKGGTVKKMAKGGKVKKMAKGGKVRGCGIAKRGLTKGKMR